MAQISQQYTSLHRQIELKELEVYAKPKQEGYAHLMNALIAAFDAAQSRNRTAVGERLDALEGAYYSIEPFLNSGRDAIWHQIQQFSGMCYALADEGVLPRDKLANYVNSYLTYKKYFREHLYEELFNKLPTTAHVPGQEESTGRSSRP
jgi:hypothetical protein